MKAPSIFLFLGLAPQVQHCITKFCEAEKTAGSIFQQVSCGYLEQGQVAVMLCCFVSKLYLLCHFFCWLSLGRASPFHDCEAWGIFFPARVGSPVPMNLCSWLSWLKTFRVLGKIQWAGSRQWKAISSGTCWQLWPACRMYQRRYLVSCFCGPHYSNQGSVLYKTYAKLSVHNGDIWQGVCRELLKIFCASKFLWHSLQLKTPAATKACCFFLPSLLFFLCN